MRSRFLALAGLLAAASCRRAPPPAPAPSCPDQPDAWRELPPGIHLGDISGSSADAWATGTAVDPTGRTFQRPTTLHFDGCAWREVRLPDEPGTMHGTAIWSGGGAVWVATSSWGAARDGGPCRSAILRRVNQRWEVVPAPGDPVIQEIRGSGASDVWMRWDARCRGDAPASHLLHWDGQRLEAVTVKGLEDVRAMWGASASSLWVSGAGGNIGRWDGKTWEVGRVASAGGLHVIAGSSPSDVWAASHGPTALLHWDGDAWSHAEPADVESRGAPILLYGAPGAAFMLRDQTAFLRRGGRWEPLLSTASQRIFPGFVQGPWIGGLWAAGPRDLWARVSRGDQTWLMRWNGERWLSPVPSPAEDLIALWWDGSAMWAAGARALSDDPAHPGDVRRLTGGRWQVVARLSQVPTRLWGLSSSDIWAVGAGGAAWHWDGKAWAERPTGVTTDLFAVWGSGPADVWAAGQWGTLVNWNGKEWRRWSTLGLGTDQELRGLWGSGADDVWAAGSKGLLHFDGRGWTVQQRFDEVLAAVWGRHRDDVWAAGLHYVPESHPSNPTNRYRPEALLIHWDGKTWTPVELEGGAPPDRLTGLTGTGPDQAWAWGPRGALVRFDGRRWAVTASPVTADLADVRADGGGVLWLAGAGGTLRNHNPPRP